MENYKHTREAAVRVKVKKCEFNVPVEWRKFSVDPQITTLEVLYSLLAKAFDTKSDFSIKYKAFDPAGNEIYLAVLSDWDLDAAFLRIHNLSIQTLSEPCLVLQMDVKPFTEVRKDCDVIELKLTQTSDNCTTSSSTYTMNANAPRHEIMTPLQQSLGASQKYVQHMQTRLPGLIMNQMEKTFSMVQKAFNLTEETMATLPPRPPLSDSEFRVFLDAVGQIQRTDELRKVIFFGGIEPGLRRVVWKHILNVYPSGMNGHQRMDYMRRKSEQYYKLRETWKTAVKQGGSTIGGELGYVTSMVKKDVLRTDRLHSFYAGSDENQNIASLFNILTTYALNHPTVSYCQGMSDIASPILVTMNDEAQAYICFCAIMFRVRGNFMLDGIAMTQKFSHLSEALSFYDPEFWEYLKSQQADDLLFCYRWLLLELKREFPFDDALRMLEVQWSSLKYDATVQNELSLYEKEFVPMLDASGPTTSSSHSSSVSTTVGAPASPSMLLTKARENPYSKFCALRRQSSTASLSSLSSSLSSYNTLDSSKRLNQSLDDNISRHVLTRRQRHAASSKAHQSLDEAKMLMLIESSEKDLSCLQQLPRSRDNDLKSVFVYKNEEMPAQFHPTNPFKEDAQQIVEEHATITVPNKPPARVFLNSNSSSFAEDEVIECNEDNVTILSSEQLSASVTKAQTKTILNNYTSVGNIIAKQLPNATTVTETMKRMGNSGGGHFKDLKDKIAATSKKGISFEDLTNTTSGVVKQPQKLVKNFNEFLNFANANKSRIADKFATTNTLMPENVNKSATIPAQSPQSPTHLLMYGAATVMPPLITHPVVQLTKSSRVPSLEDSDSTSSLGHDTTWSNSTAATAIQQAQEISCASLQLDLNSLSSANYSCTPDRTPGTFSPLRNEMANDLNPTPDDNQDAEQDYFPIATAMTRELRLEADNLDRQVFGDNSLPGKPPIGSDIEYEQLERDRREIFDEMHELNLKEDEILACSEISELFEKGRQRRCETTGGGTTYSGDGGDGSTTTTSSSHNNYRLDFEEFNDDEDEDEDNDEVFVPTKNLETKKLNSFDNTTTLGHKLNPFLDDALHSVPSASIPNSNSLHEVLVPISTTSLETNVATTYNAILSTPTPVELATNAADDEAQFQPYMLTKSESSSTTMTATTTTASTTTSIEVNGISSPTILPAPPALPPPHQFGGGNPFLMFLCVTLLLQHRNTIIKNGMDYNEIAMHFDKMVRKHDVTRVLNQARRMYIDYLKTQNAYRHRMQQAASSATRGTKKREKYSTKEAQPQQQLKPTQEQQQH